MKKIIIPFVITVLLIACKEDSKTNKDMIEKSNAWWSAAGINPDDVMASVSLTVAESKRLIAKGIAQHPLVKQKLASGTIIITRGSTNTYIAEELVGLDASHGQFVTGNITPVKGLAIEFGGDKVPEIIIIDGKRTEMPFKEALASLKEGDIVFKGGNLLNYDLKQVAVTVGAADFGTVGRIQPYTKEGPAHLIVPIGLEKQVYGDLNEYSRILATKIQKKGFIPQIIVHQNAEIFTEIEAIKLFGQVEVIPYASGGLAGSEGGKSFAIYGSQAEIEKVLKQISEIQGEKAFIE